MKSVPGSVLETILAEVRGGDALPTYDFVDVINRDSKVGWQVKSNDGFYSGHVEASQDS